VTIPWTETIFPRSAAESLAGLTYVCMYVCIRRRHRDPYRIQTERTVQSNGSRRIIRIERMKVIIQRLITRGEVVDGSRKQTVRVLSVKDAEVVDVYSEPESICL
jgi:hypothetical protein